MVGRRSAIAQATATWAVGALCLVGCAGTESYEGVDDIDSLGQRIVGGEPSGPEDDSVVYLVAGDEGERPTCTASLIAPDVVLTALHCVTHNVATNFSCTPDGMLATQPPQGVIGTLYDASTVKISVGGTPKTTPDAIGVKVFGSGTTQICRGDIAVVVLDRELDQPSLTLSFNRRVRRGEMLRLVGFGGDGMTDSLRHTRSGARITDVGADAKAKADGIAAPYTFAATEGACLGDSGGPAFSEETGAIVGVYSISAAASCTALGVRNTYTQVAPFKDLITKALEFAGRKALVEPAQQTDAGGNHKPSDDETDVDLGSGSREDPSCFCSAPRPAHNRASWTLLSLGLSLLWALRRSQRNAC